MREKVRDTNELTSLADLRPDHQQRINVIAVAATLPIPMKSKGQQMGMKMELVDQSTNTVVTCNLFGGLDFLPNPSIVSHPAIVRLRRMKVEMFAGRTQLVHTPGWSWSLFSKDINNFIPEDKSHINTAMKLTAQETTRICDLREWINSEAFAEATFERGFLSDTGGGGGVSKETSKFNKFCDSFIPLSDVEENLYFDAVLQVIAVNRSSRNRVILRCIDGSMPSVKTFKTNSLYFSSPLSQFVIAQLCDYYMDVSVYEEHTLTAEAVHAQDFVEFRNLHCYTPRAGGEDKPEVVLHKGFTFRRGLRRVPAEDPRAAQIAQQVRAIKLYAPDETPQREVPPYIPPESATTCSYPLPLTSLLDLVQQKNCPPGVPVVSHPPVLAKVRVFVESYSPDNYPDFLRSYCVPCMKYQDRTALRCASCSSAELTSEVFFRLCVRNYIDGYPVDVLCYAANARAFLGIEEVGEVALGRIEEVEKIVHRWCDLIVFWVEDVGVVMSGKCRIAGS